MIGSAGAMLNATRQVGDKVVRMVLRLVRVETSVDSKIAKGRGILEGCLQGTLVLGASSATLSNNWLR